MCELSKMSDRYGSCTVLHVGLSLALWHSVMHSSFSYTSISRTLGALRHFSAILDSTRRLSLSQLSLPAGDRPVITSSHTPHFGVWDYHSFDFSNFRSSQAGHRFLSPQDLYLCLPASTDHYHSSHWRKRITAICVQAPALSQHSPGMTADLPAISRVFLS